MGKKRELSEYSRQELYDLVWSIPASKLAPDFGISDVAIAKHCKNKNVPRPSRGYWAKLEAGGTPSKVPLPPTPDELFKEAAQRRAAKALPLPKSTETLLPPASDLINAITAAKLDYYKRAHLEDRAFPALTVSKNLATRVAQAFHVLLKELEPIGIRFRKFQGCHESGYFERRRDRLYVTITEDIVRPDGSRVTIPYWQSAEKDEKPCGYLTFSFTSSRWRSSDTKQWSESAKRPLEQTLAEVVDGVRKHFLDLQERAEQEAIEREKQRIESERRWREHQKQEAIRLQQEKERKHAEAVAAAKKARRTNLIKAAEDWRFCGSLLEFVEQCERHWKSQSQPLTPEQLEWLAWAKQTARTASTFPADFPDPTKDGGFDPNSIPLGGPYPACRKLNE